jgi:hypothetical protein
LEGVLAQLTVPVGVAVPLALTETFATAVYPDQEVLGERLSVVVVDTAVGCVTVNGTALLAVPFNVSV